MVKEPCAVTFRRVWCPEDFRQGCGPAHFVEASGLLPKSFVEPVPQFNERHNQNCGRECFTHESRQSPGHDPKTRAGRGETRFVHLRSHEQDEGRAGDDQVQDGQDHHDGHDEREGTDHDIHLPRGGLIRRAPDDDAAADQRERREDHRNERVPGQGHGYSYPESQVTRRPFAFTVLVIQTRPPSWT